MSFVASAAWSILLGLGLFTLYLALTTGDQQTVKYRLGQSFACFFALGVSIFIWTLG